MSAWIVVPCLIALRNEFNAVSPNRDKGADGTIGDASHTSDSDHTPDEDSDVLRNYDGDRINEVHALDIDMSGPWPGGWTWFDNKVQVIVDNHKAGRDNRLYYVIWNRWIAGTESDWEWVVYDGTNPHTDHAHFSARYITSTENDTSPWGVEEEEDMATPQEVVAEFVKQLKDPNSALFSNMRAIGWKYPVDGDETPRSALRVFQDEDAQTDSLVADMTRLKAENVVLNTKLDTVISLLQASKKA